LTFGPGLAEIRRLLPIDSVCAGRPAARKNLDVAAKKSVASITTSNYQKLAQ
jgi:hypothetical protein